MIDPALFARHIGSEFTVDTAGGPVRLQLAEVKDDGVARGVHQFSLFFHGPADRLLAGQIHAFAHPELGDHDIFIAPVEGSSATRIVYQACFSVAA